MMKYLHVLVFVFSSLWTATSHAGNCGKLNASPESHGYARQLDCRLAEESNKEVKVTLNTLVIALESNPVSGDEEHDALGVKILLDEHESWLAYRNAHCQMKSHLFVYPSGSKLSIQVFHQCTTTMNLTRIKNLHGMLHEFVQ